jgi:hypothetical protein
VVGRRAESGQWRAIRYDGTAFSDQIVAQWSTATNWQQVMPAGNLPGISNVTLRRHVLEENPGMAEALAGDTLAALEMLRNWSANAANFAIAGDVEDDTEARIGSMTAAEMYYYEYLPNRGGSYCGGLGVFFDRVLKAFGIGSFTVNFGDLGDNLTHVSVIVPLQVEGQWKFYMFDPTFNITYHDASSGQLLDYFEIIDRLGAEQPESVVFLGSSLADRDWVSYRENSNPDLELRYVSNGIYVYGQPDYGFHTYLDEFAQQFADNGYLPGIAGWIQLMQARVFSVGTSLNPVAVDAFRAELTARGIPYGTEDIPELT